MSAMEDDELLRLAARGALAGAVTAELAEPLAQVGDVLAELVDRLDRHVATARGPEPLPWSAVGMVRERLADAYLGVGRIRRLAADLALVSAERDGRRPERVDVNDLVERALSLARHRFAAADQEVLLDLGTVPEVIVDPERLVGAMAHLMLDVAAAAEPGSTVAVRTAAPSGAEVGLTVSYVGAPTREAPFSAFASSEIELEGGSVSYITDGVMTQVVVLLAAAK